MAKKKTAKAKAAPLNGLLADPTRCETCGDAAEISVYTTVLLTGAFKTKRGRRVFKATCVTMPRLFTGCMTCGGKSQPFTQPPFKIES